MSRQQWADDAYEALARGEAVRVRPRGNSMSGRIEDGDLVTLEPFEADTLAPGEIVFVRIEGRRYFHLVLHQVLEREQDRFLMGNNLGGVDGWVTVQDIFGWIAAIEPGRTMP